METAKIKKNLKRKEICVIEISAKMQCLDLKCHIILATTTEKLLIKN